MTTLSSTTSSVSLATLGVGSGLNDASIISGIVAAQSAPLTALQAQQAKIQSASQTISTFASDLSALQSAAKALSDPTQYSSYTASSSASSVVATATGSATVGTHSVAVHTLAQAQVTYSEPQSSSTDALGLSGSLGITVGGNQVNVPVSSGDSLATIAANIASSGAPVTASVVFDGSSYRLQVQSLSTGASSAITFDDGGMGLGLSTAKNTYQAATDASATIDGIDVTSSTNQITGAISGVTLALTNTTSTPTTVTVGTSSSALAAQISTFITAYNKVVTDGHTDTGYGTTPASNSILTGDHGIQSALNQISGFMGESVPGTSGTYQSLGSVGISVKSDGTLTLDSKALDAAVTANPSGVERLFVTDSKTGSTGMMQTLSKAIDGLVTGSTSVMQTEISSYSTRIKAMTTEETNMQTRITAYTAQLQKEFQAMEQTVNQQKALWGEVGGSGTFV